MVQKSIIVLAGLGVLVITGTLLSFKDKDGKKKKYEIIHHSKGKTVTYDTVLPINSKFTVQDFLASKGLKDVQSEIIELKGEDHKMIFKMHDDLEKEGMNWEQKEENVQINVTTDDNGKMTVVKKVNGQEVAVSPEEMKEIEENMKNGKTHVVKIREMDSDGPGFVFHGEPKEGEQRVEIQCEKDKDGNLKVVKKVNGKEVELTPEELEKIKNHKEGEGQRMIFIHDSEGSGDMHMEHMGKGENRVEIKAEKGKDGKMEVKKFVNGKEVELTPEERKRIESHEAGEGHQMHREMHREGQAGEGKNGEKKVIRIERCIEESETNDGQEKVIVRSHDVNWVSDNEDEEFVLVIVTEESNETTTKAKTADKKSGVEGKNTADIKVFPNPNDGDFTLLLNQPEKAKTNIRIHDGQGKLVLEENLGEFKGTYSKKVDLKQFGAGTYIVTVEQGKKKTNEKIVVSK